MLYDILFLLFSLKNIRGGKGNLYFFTSSISLSSATWGKDLFGFSVLNTLPLCVLKKHLSELNVL